MADRRDLEVDEMWHEAKPAVLERCDLVRRTAAAGSGTSDAVRDAAHKLAGALGMFGLREASRLAQRLDELVVDGGLDDERAADAAALAAELDAAIRDDR